ncbi:uncharacterized protein [Apostichopus japonicus]|uniref:uncharacterized protein n=1 Tax=Stichopus japonicus TaxID=307972 RepID=UPI003AB27A1C
MSPSTTDTNDKVTLMDSARMRRAKTVNRIEESTVNRQMKKLSSEQQRVLEHFRKEKEKLVPSLRRLKVEQNSVGESHGSKKELDWIPLSHAGSLPSLCPPRHRGDSHSDTGSISVHSDPYIRPFIQPQSTIHALCSPRLTRRNRKDAGLRRSPPDMPSRSTSENNLTGDVIKNDTQDSSHVTPPIQKQVKRKGGHNGVKKAWAKPNDVAEDTQHLLSVPAISVHSEEKAESNNNINNVVSPRGQKGLHRDVPRSPRSPRFRTVDNSRARIIDNRINPVITTVDSRSRTNPNSCVHWNVTSTRLRSLRIDKQASNRLRLSDLDLTYGNRFATHQDDVDLAEEMKKLENCRYLRGRRSSSDEIIYKPEFS